jgi:uncharacterized protein YbjT (DUF2867 family)
MQKPILVIGATGNIGTALIRTLAAKGIDCIAGIRNEAKADEIKSLGVPLVDFNFDDPRTMENAFRKSERAFLLLPLTPSLVEHGLAAIRAAKEASISFIVRSSEFQADRASTELAFRSQGMVDDALRESGIPCSIIRPNFFMQNFAVYYRESIRRKNTFYLPQGSGRISFVDVRDIAEAAAELLISPAEHAGLTYDLTGPESLSNHDVASLLSDTLSKRVEYAPLDESVAIEDMRQRGLPEWNIEFVTSLHRYVRDGRMAEVAKAVGDIIGKRPRSFTDFINDHREAWM